jgi:hypothetical protein
MISVTRIRVENNVAYVFLSILIHGQMHRTKGASPNFILDNVLIDVMLCLAIFLIICVLALCIQGFLHNTMFGCMATVMSQRTLVCRRRATISSANILDQANVHM